MQQWPEEVIQRIEKLESKIQNLEIENQELHKENQELKEKIKNLEKRLVYYENAHTPPSARKLPKKKDQDAEKSEDMKKRGAPKGQDLNKVEKNTVEDLPPPQEIKVTQFNRHRVKCRDCGHEFISKPPDLLCR